MVENWELKLSFWNCWSPWIFTRKSLLYEKKKKIIQWTAVSCGRLLDNAPCHKAKNSNWFHEHDNEFSVPQWIQTPMGCDRTGDSQHECAADKSAEIVWCKECFQLLVESIPWRIEAVLRAKGGSAQYWYIVPNEVLSGCNYSQLIFFLYIHINDY